MYSYDKTIAITNRGLCKEAYLEQLEKIAAVHPLAIILREKEMEEEDYLMLVEEVLPMTEKHRVPLILHSHIGVAKRLGNKKIHLPLPLLRTLGGEMELFKELGVSIHSVEEAVEAERLGATYLTAGHIFQTDCKKGLKPRGLDFLEDVVNHVHIPVYAIGGINEDNAYLALERGAAGVCMMSAFMTM